MFLSIIAETCGGVAMCFHSQGVASNLLLNARSELPMTPARAALCLQEDFGFPGWGTILSPEKDLPARISTQAELSGNEYILRGLKTFVYSIENVEAFAVLARLDDKWACFIVPSDVQGLSLHSTGVRTGLRACNLYDVEFRDVKVPANFRIDDGDGLEFFLRAYCLNLLGLSAIAVGIARGAVNSAKKYASERYQGGKMIEEHPAIKMLIADSDARMQISEAGVLSNMRLNPGLVKSLKSAAMTKLNVLEQCSQAVTDSLQTFGGYGYMDDFGMSKRLRDIAVLKSASGAPHYLKQLIFDIDKQG